MSPATADRASAVVFAVLGAAMLVGGWTMDRLEIRRIHPASIPGLVPMILGAALLLCAVLLWRSAGRAEAASPTMTPAVDAMTDADATTPDERVAVEGPSPVALAFTALWSAFYALALVGTLPFVVATVLYVAGFVLFFTWREQGAPSLGRVAFALGFATITATAIAALFRYAFLVRLP